MRGRSEKTLPLTPVEEELPPPMYDYVWRQFVTDGYTPIDVELPRCLVVTLEHFPEELGFSPESSIEERYAEIINAGLKSARIKAPGRKGGADCACGDRSRHALAD